MKQMRLLISGYRDFNDYNFIKNAIDILFSYKIEEAQGENNKKIEEYESKKSENVIIHGGCRGCDGIAEEVAREMNVRTEVYKPDWSKGKIAGPLRNQEMIDKGKPDFAILFISEYSKGTLDMKSRIIKSNIPHKIYNI